jgi:hypothetical protein
MSKLKQLSIAVLVLALGIVFVNSYLFSSPANSCLCHGEDIAQRECENWCPLGMCMHVHRWWSACDDGCHSYWTVYCENGAMGYLHTYVECLDCGGW